MTAHEKRLRRAHQLDCGIIIGFTIVFLFFYPVQMYIAEVYVADDERYSMFTFMVSKYCFGWLHIVSVPLIILGMRRDIRKSAADAYVRSNADDGEITFEQLQEHVGIGVDIG